MAIPGGHETADTASPIAGGNVEQWHLWGSSLVVFYKQILIIWLNNPTRNVSPWERKTCFYTNNCTYIFIAHNGKKPNVLHEVNRQTVQCSCHEMLHSTEGSESPAPQQHGQLARAPPRGRSPLRWDTVCDPLCVKSSDDNTIVMEDWPVLAGGSGQESQSPGRDNTEVCSWEVTEQIYVLPVAGATQIRTCDNLTELYTPPLQK